MDATPDIIVRETLFGRKPGEERFAIAIEVGRPFAWGGASPTEYACRVAAEPIMSMVAIHGEGPTQALCLALRHVRFFLDSFQNDGGVIEDIDLDATMPFRPYSFEGT